MDRNGFINLIREAESKLTNFYIVVGSLALGNHEYYFTAVTDSAFKASSKNNSNKVYYIPYNAIQYISKSF